MPWASIEHLATQRKSQMTARAATKLVGAPDGR
jgi:hypothetical protein